MIGRSVVFIVTVAGLLLAGCEARPQTAFDARCWIRSEDGKLSVLDAHVENLETCGARLAVRHIQQGKPVRGAFGGVEVFVDAHSMEAGTPYGDYRVTLLSAADRQRVDAAIRQLLAAQPAGAG